MNAELISHHNGDSFKGTIFGYTIFCFCFALFCYDSTQHKLSKIILYRNAFSGKIKETLVSPTTLMDIGYLSFPESRSLQYVWIFSHLASQSVKETTIHCRNFKNPSIYLLELSCSWNVGAELRLRQPMSTTHTSNSELL